MIQEQTFDNLLERIRQGDTQASEDLVKQYETEVRRFVRYRLSSGKMRRFLDSLDICQSVFANFFFRVTQGQFELQDPTQLRKLLIAMAGNKLMDHFRKQGTARRGHGVAESPMFDNLAESGPGPAQQVEAKDLMDVLRTRLSQEETDMLDQWLLGEDWQTIATRHDASPEAVRKRFTRTLDRVAQEFGWGA
jgi:RNA polymerase sigma factor (sigma-70 family)